MKILKIEKCFHCSFFDYNIDIVNHKTKNKCNHIDVIREGEFSRLITTKKRYNGDIPNWCPLEDYK